MTAPLRAHPAAEVFPMLPDRELDDLASDIKANGLRHPIVVVDGKGEWLILDGRNRYEACLRAGVQPAREVWSGSDPKSYVVSANLHRRHMDASQRATAAAKLATLDRGGRSNASIEAFKASQDEAAALLNVSRSSVQRATVVLEHGTPELVAAVEAGDVSVAAAAEVAALPAEEQAPIVAAGPSAIKAKARERRKKPAAKAPPAEPANDTASEPETDAPLTWKPAEWDAEDFLCDVRNQNDDSLAEWVRHGLPASRFIADLRLYLDVMEKKNARDSASNG